MGKIATPAQPGRFLPFSRPSIREEDIAAVSDVLRSGWITTGEKAAEFERRFAERVGSGGAVAVTSATAAMHLVFRALGLGPGDEVVTPSLTWVTVPNLVLLAGARPVFADVDRDTLMVTADSLRPCITERTRLLIPVHFAGAAADMAPIRELAGERGIQIIEDAAHALGTQYQGVPVGKEGTAVFSFHPIKNLTCGEGGMLCSDDPELLERVRALRFHGLGQDAYDREIQGRAPQAEVLEPGYKYNLTDVAAALGLSQLDRLAAFNARRASLAERYRLRLGGIEALRPLALPEYPFDHASHLFVVRLATELVGITRDDLMGRLKKRGIGTGLHFRAVHEHRYYRDHLPVRSADLPNTEWNSARVLSLPLFPDMTFDDVDRVSDALMEELDV